MQIKFTTKDLGVKTRLDRLEARMKNITPALKECGLVLIRSVAKNFAAGGRLVRWKPSLRARTGGGKTLIKTARLKNSMTMKAFGRVLRVGTNVKYAAIHHLGGRIRKNVKVKQHYRIITKAFGKSISGRKVLVRSHGRQMNMNMPARPFLMAQDADIRIFKRILSDHIAG